MAKSKTYPIPLKSIPLALLIAIIVGFIFGVIGFTFIIGVFIAIALFLYIIEPDSTTPRKKDK